MDFGGGEYERPDMVKAETALYRVKVDTDLPTLRTACERWASDNPASAVIELTENRVYEEPVHIELREGQSLEIRAVNGVRPVIDLLDWRASRPDALTITGAVGSRITLDGVLVTGRGIDVRGAFEEIIFRHCTLVPGWSLHQDVRPRRPAEPSLSLLDASGRVRIDRCIVGGDAIHNSRSCSCPHGRARREFCFHGSGSGRAPAAWLREILLCSTRVTHALAI